MAEQEVKKTTRNFSEDIVTEKIKGFRQGLLEMREQRNAYQEAIDDLETRIARTEGALLALQELVQPTESQMAQLPPAPVIEANGDKQE